MQWYCFVVYSLTSLRASCVRSCHQSRQSTASGAWYPTLVETQLLVPSTTLPFPQHCMEKVTFNLGSHYTGTVKLMKNQLWYISGDSWVALFAKDIQIFSDCVIERLAVEQFVSHSRATGCNSRIQVMVFVESQSLSYVWIPLILAWPLSWLSEKDVWEFLSRLWFLCSFVWAIHLNR